MLLEREREREMRRDRQKHQYCMEDDGMFLASADTSIPRGEAEEEKEKRKGEAVGFFCAKDREETVRTVPSASPIFVTAVRIIILIINKLFLYGRERKRVAGQSTSSRLETSDQLTFGPRDASTMLTSPANADEDLASKSPR